MINYIRVYQPVDDLIEPPVDDFTEEPVGVCIEQPDGEFSEVKLDQLTTKTAEEYRGDIRNSLNGTVNGTVPENPNAAMQLGSIYMMVPLVLIILLAQMMLLA